MIPVRPGITTIDGQQVYARLQDVPAQLGGAILLVTPRLLDRYIDDCRAAKITRVWLDEAHYPHVGELAARLAKQGIRTVSTIAVANGGTERRRARSTLRWLGGVLGMRGPS